MARSFGGTSFPKPSLNTIAAAVGGSIIVASSEESGAPPFLAGGGGLGATGLAINPLQLIPGGRRGIESRYGEFGSGAIVTARRIDTLSAGFKSFQKPLMTALRTVIVPSIKRNFEAQGRPPWKALTRKTIYNRLMEGYPRGPILDKSGRLKREAVKLNNWEYRNNELAFRGLYFTQKVPYASFHQFGARTRLNSGSASNLIMGRVGSSGFSVRVGQSRQLVPRPFIQLTTDEEAEIFTIFMAYVVEKVNEAWEGE